MYAIRHVRSQDRVLLYNYSPEFILAALYLKIIGRPATLDIEDAPRKDQSDFRGLGNRISFRMLAPLCTRKCVTAARKIGERLGLRSFLTVYGVASYFDAPASTTPKFADEKVKILYGGVIMASTGLDLFVGAVRHLIAVAPDLPIHFFITGTYPDVELRAFAQEVETSSRFRLTPYSGLSMAEYRDLAKQVDIGLCLKLPSHSVGQTTFPSKAIEYAALGMLVCATAVSDIPIIFDESTGIILASESPEELASAILDAVTNRARSAARAQAGRQRVFDRFSRKNVGHELVEFLFG
jgi:glycosyltransferase involved in cell wall biosynthesis